jgi:hypothetical protein
MAQVIVHTHFSGLSTTSRIDDVTEESEVPQRHEKSTGSSPENDGLLFPPNGEVFEVYDQKPALEHFRLLIKFMQEYFHDQLELKKRIKVGAEEKIEFENLWMLFETGTTIYAPYRESGHTLTNLPPPGSPATDMHTSPRRDLPQAYRVTATSGGTALRKAVASTINKETKNKDRMIRLFRTTDDIADSQRTRNRYSPLYVYCFYIDFDGIRYGTVREIFVFRPYEGKVDIKSLQAHPLLYSQCPENLLTERGRKFIDLTAVSHMSYEGLSVGERREEVRYASWSF